MSFNNTYTNGFPYSNQSSSTSSSSNFLNQVRNERKNSVGDWRTFTGTGTQRPNDTSDMGFLRNTMGSFGSRPNKQLFESAALQGERKRETNLRRTTGNLGDILRNLNFDKQLRDQQTPKSNKYSNPNLSNSSYNIHNNNANIIEPQVINTEGFRKEKHMHSTVYQSRPLTSYEPLSETVKKQPSGKKFDVDEMFNKIKRQKELEFELKRLREEKRLRQEKQKERERLKQYDREKQKQKITKQYNNEPSSSFTSQKYSSTYSSPSSTNKQSTYNRPATNYNTSTTEEYSYTNGNTSNDYDSKYGSFSKKERYGTAYTPKRQYQFEKKTYQFEKKYDTAGKKQYDWKKPSQKPSFLKDYNNSTTKVTSFQTDPISNYKNTPSKSPISSSKDAISKYFSSSSKEKVQKFDCKVTIRDFRLGKQLGEGKFGTVYQAFHKQTNSLYALKKVPKSIIKSHYMIDQFILELKLQSFMNNEHILALHGFFHDSQNIYLILDYMQEGTLYSVLKKNKKLQYTDAATKIKQIAKGIIYMHENGIAHRDIKPENVVMSNGSCKLCDFGWSTICDERRKTYCGTFDYAAPEILQGAQYDMSVDLWCLGVMAYELLVGKAPFYHIKKEQTKKRILNVESQPISFPSDMPRDAVDFIDRLLKKDPQERIKNEELLYHPFLAKV